MVIKEQVPAVVSPYPNSFAGLMEMYESNYMQLQLLLTNIRQLPDLQVVAVEGRVPVLLQVRERSQHTATLLMTYCFTGGQGAGHDTRPDMLVRVYYDALQAEVISHRCRLSDRLFRYQDADPDSMLRCRWRMNRFLFKWVGYLRRQGYRFHLQDGL